MFPAEDRMAHHALPCQAKLASVSGVYSPVIGTQHQSGQLHSAIASFTRPERVLHVETGSVQFLDCSDLSAAREGNHADPGHGREGLNALAIRVAEDRDVSLRAFGDEFRDFGAHPLPRRRL
jgi:hypothetical protein